MTVEEFTKTLEAEFDEVVPGTITPTTNYRDIQNWSSMHALIIIAFVDMHFNITLNGADLRNTQTIQDLYNIVIAKQKSV